MDQSDKVRYELEYSKDADGVVKWIESGGVESEHCSRVSVSEQGVVLRCAPPKKRIKKKILIFFEKPFRARDPSFSNWHLAPSPFDRLPLSCSSSTASTAPHTHSTCDAFRKILYFAVTVEAKKQNNEESNDDTTSVT